MSSAGVFIRAKAGEILQALHASCGVEYKLGHAAVAIYRLWTKKFLK